jgi:hypothetical protein
MGGVSRGFAIEELCREVRSGGADFALIAENPSGEIVGEAYAAILSAREAEAAFVVRDPDQHHGVGTALRGGWTERHLNGGVHVTLQIDASRPIETPPPPS